MIAAFRTAFPDICWVIEEMVADGDKVFSRFTWHETHRSEFFRVSASGKQISVKGMVFDRVVASETVESRILMDGLSMMRQLEVIFPNGQQERRLSENDLMSKPVLPPRSAR